MAISILDTPDAYSPVYNPVHYLLSSTSVNKESFKYVVYVYTGLTVTGAPVARLRPDKRPTTGYGLVDVSGVLRSFYDHEKDLQPGAGEFLSAPNYALYHTLSIGESYAYFSFIDSYYGPSGRVLFSGSDFHDFVVGDEVTIQQTSPYLYPEWNGPHVIIDVPDAHSFTIDYGFQSGPVTPGKVWHADGSNISYSGLSSVTGRTVSFALPREEFTTYTNDRFIGDPGNTDIEMMTNAPTGLRFKRNGQGWIPCQNDGHILHLFITTKDANGTTVGSYRIDNGASSAYPFCYTPAGPANLTASTFTVISGPSTMFASNVETYTLSFGNGSGIISESRTYGIDNRCDPYERFDLLMCDKMGSWMSFSFNHKNTQENTVKKQTYSKGGYARVVGTSVTYADTRRGFDPYNTEHIISYTLRTDWLNQAESNYLVELLMSPRAYWMTSSTTFIPIVLDDTKVERLVVDQEETLVRYEVTMTKAYKEPSIG